MFRRLAVSAAVLTYLLIIMGGIVRVSGSGLGCGAHNDWPLCHGSLLPPLQANAIIEFTHRWVAALATLLVIALTIAAWVWERRHRRLVIASSLAAVLFVVQIALGALTVEFKLPGGVVMIHLANALLLLAVLAYVATTATTAGRSHLGPVVSTAMRRSTLLAAAGTYVIALSGAFVVENGAGAACAGWPLCGGGWQLAASGLATVNLAHRIIAGVVVLGVGAVIGVLLRRSRNHRALRLSAMSVAVLLLLQIAAGALVIELGLPPAVRALHIALASALWAATVIVAVLTAPPVALPAPSRDGSRRAESVRTPAGAASL